MMDDRYLDLLKKVLTGNIYQEEFAFSVVEPKSGWSPAVIMKRMIIKIAASHGIKLTKSCKFVPEEREEGRDWPGLGYTMVGLKRLDNVQHAIETVIRERIPGDLCECGVWRGGTAMFMRAALMHYGENGRSVWVADSFSGLPKPDTVRYPGDSSSQDHSEVDYLSVSLKRVRQNFQEFGLLDENVRFLEGWFKDTLPTAPIKQLVHLAGSLNALGSVSGHERFPLHGPAEGFRHGGIEVGDERGQSVGCQLNNAKVERLVNLGLAQRGPAPTVATYPW